MFTSNIARAVASIVLVCGSAAHADLLVGDFREAIGTAPILRFDDSAAGAAAPIDAFYTNLGGGIDVLNSAASMTYEPLEYVVYAADFYGKAIRVYRAGASGNTAALRTLNPPQLGQPIQVAISLAHQELIAVTGNGVQTYLLRDSGSTPLAQRTLPLGPDAGSRTRLNNPGGIILRQSSDEIAVPDHGIAAGAGFGVVLFFSRSLTGNSAPRRTLEGSQTKLGAAAFGIAYDSRHDEIYVLSQDSSDDPTLLRISTFAGNAAGNTAPLRSISGSNTLIADAHALSYDPVAQLLYVSAGGDNGVPPRVLAFARGANGDVAPDRVIVANGDSFVLPLGITSVYDELFADGFD